MLVLLATDVVRSCRQRTASSRTRCSISSNDEMALRRCRDFSPCGRSGGHHRRRAAPERLQVGHQQADRRVRGCARCRAVPSLDAPGRPERPGIGPIREDARSGSGARRDDRAGLDANRRAARPASGHGADDFWDAISRTGACRVRARPPGPRSRRQGARSRRERLRRGDPHRAPPGFELDRPQVLPSADGWSAAARATRRRGACPRASRAWAPTSASTTPTCIPDGSGNSSHRRPAKSPAHDPPIKARRR